MQTPGSQQNPLSPRPSNLGVSSVQHCYWADRCNFPRLDCPRCLVRTPGLAPCSHRSWAANMGRDGCRVCCFANGIAGEVVLMGHVGLVAPTWL